MNKGFDDSIFTVNERTLLGRIIEIASDSWDLWHADTCELAVSLIAKCLWADWSNISDILLKAARDIGIESQSDQNEISGNVCREIVIKAYLDFAGKFDVQIFNVFIQPKELWALRDMGININESYFTVPKKLVPTVLKMLRNSKSDFYIKWDKRLFKH